jgi:uncharacterized protein (TIGR02246 family)
VNRPLGASWHVCVCCCALIACAAFAQPPASPPDNKPKTAAPAGSDEAELAAVRATSGSFITAFNKGDAKAVAAHWTEDGDYTDESGAKFSGREAIEREYARFFAAHPGHKIKLTIDSLKLLGDSAAIEDGRASLDPPPAGAPATSKYTAIHVKADGKWLMSTVRDSRIETPSTYGNVADLEWLIGTWTAEEHGARTESVCRWVAGKSFVERSYTVTRADGTTASGVQLIGWNPQGGRVQSWNFSSDGGHAIGVWTPRDGGWSAEIRGTTGDGTPTTAVNLLTKLDDNAYVWQSVNRTAGGQPLADTGEVILKRSER